jgi:hypothetical protein
MTPAAPNPQGQIRRLALAALTATLAACLAIAAPVAAAKKKGGGTLNVTRTLNAPIPDRASNTGPVGVFSTTIDVGKQFKGRKIRDVNVTVQTAGTSPYDPTNFGPVNNLTAKLFAPNGAHTTLFGFLLAALIPGGSAPNQNLGPLTLDDESPLSLGSFAPHNATEIYAPWAGTAMPIGKPLAVMDGGPARGTWTLTITDRGNGQTSNLVSWSINAVTGPPFLTK